MIKFQEGAQLYDDTYTGRVKHSYKLYHPKNALYSDEQILAFNKELKEYLKTGETKLTNDELWNRYYIVKSNLHPETEQPVNKVFRWCNFVPTNIPLILGIAVLPPTTFNQILFQSLNQSYNFGVNVSNASASNQKSNNELMISYLAAVSSAIIGSAGLRSFLQKRNMQGALGKLLVLSTPYLGLVLASSVNLFFSRSKELSSGIPIDDPATGQPIPDLKSKAAARSAFFESWLIRIMIPLPLIFVPMAASRWAANNTAFYKKTAPKLLFDTTVVAGSLWGALVFVMSGFSNTGKIKLGQLEPQFKQKLSQYPDDKEITFTKGL